MDTPPLDRDGRRRLAIIRHVEEISGNIAATCRYFGITRQAYYVMLRRYQAEGVEGLRTRSKRPRTSPNATHPEVVGKLSTCGRTTTSARRRSPCTSSATTTCRSPTLACGASCTASGWAGYPPRSATNATTGAGNATRNNSPATVCKSTSNSWPHCPAPASASTSTPPSTTAPAYACYASTPPTTRRPPSNSWTTSYRDYPSQSR